MRIVPRNPPTLAGTCAEYAAVPAITVVQLPTALTFENAAVVWLQGGYGPLPRRSAFPLTRKGAETHGRC